MSNQKCIIIGGSHAAATLVSALRQQGWKGGILVVTEEYHLPYHRPPLSKAYLQTDKAAHELLIRPTSIYEKWNVQFALGCRVESIDRENKHITLQSGELLLYDKLVLTTGASPRALDIPGASLDGVCYLRNINDAQFIRDRAKKSESVVIVGGGYIGLEVAASLRSMDLSVTVLEFLPRILSRVTAPEVSEFYSRVHKEEGVNIVCNAQVSSIQGETNVERVICANGDEYQADLVVVGIGVLPNIELAENCGLDIENGILVNEFSQTNDENIFAAGDCTTHFNPIYRRNIRLESIQNASDQAMNVAKTLSGKPEPYSELPWFWSDQYDLKLQLVGLSQGYEQVVIRGDIKNTRCFAAFYLQGQKLLAVDAVNMPPAFIAGKKLISQSIDCNPEILADTETKLNSLF